MSNLFQRMALKVLTQLGTESAVVKRAAQKAARAQHNFVNHTLPPASEKAGLWLGAAAREVMLDIKATTAYLKGESLPGEGTQKEELPKTQSSSSHTSEASKPQRSGQQRPFQ